MNGERCEKKNECSNYPNECDKCGALSDLRNFYPCFQDKDIVEVVRCKDCKHNVANWKHDELDIGDYTDITCDYFMTDGMEADDYCSYGERKEG